jgi:hypothetical protein
MASAEQKKSYAVVKNFTSLNTKANRTAIKEEEFSWIENAMPIGHGNIKIIPAQSSVKDSGGNAIAFANTISFLTSANIDVNDYILGFEANGRSQYVKLDSSGTGNIANVAAAGTFSSANVSAAQYKNQRVIIGDPDKGLFSWDGANVSSIGAVGFIGVRNAGSGFATTPSVTLSAPQETTGNVQATAIATISNVAGSNVVTTITLTNAGQGYTAPPTVTIAGGGANTSATAIASLVTFKTGTVSVVMNTLGTGYTNSSNVTVTIGDVTGWTTRATANAIVSGGQITQILMSNPGAGYTSTSNVTVVIADSSGTPGSGATATGVINLDQIVDVATFSGRVWVAAGRTVYYSAAGSYSDFTSVSAGSLVLTDSTLHGNIRGLLSANNFLYIFGDDSINVFSDVRVTTSGATLFTNTNVSASVGTKRIYAIFPYFRSVLFMNDYGVYALVGSTTSKISDQLDGVFPYIDFTQPVSGGQVLLNNILCAAFSFTYSDPSSYPVTARIIQAVFFEKKWFISSQGNLTYVTSVPLSGLINLYGTTNTNLYKLYSDSTSNISSKIQTALMPMGDPIRTKQALKFGIEATLTNAATFNVTVDSEYSSSPVYTITNGLITWVNNIDAIVTWTNVFGTTIGFIGSGGYNLYKSDAQQYGKYLGLTMTSNNAAFVVNTFEFEHELRVRF